MKRSDKGINDERIICALLSNGTIKKAAEAAGVSERTVYTRLSEGDFRAAYQAAKSDMIRAAVFDINNQLTAAIRTVSEIMQDPANNAAVRLQAAQTILNNAARYTARLQSDEDGIASQVESNRYMF